MSAPPYMPLFVDDYLADTTHLDTEEHGAYLLLLMTAWKQSDCSLPDNDRKLARICRVSTRKWKHIREAMLDFFYVEDGVWKHKRLQKERTYVEKFSKSQSEKAKKRWKKQPSENKEKQVSRGKSPAESPANPAGDAPQPQPYSDTLEADASNAGSNLDWNKPPDITKAVFDGGIQAMVEDGVQAKRARSIIGKWRKDYGDPVVLVALSAFAEQSPRPSSAIEWLTGSMRHHQLKVIEGGKHAGKQPAKRGDGFTQIVQRGAGLGDFELPSRKTH